METKIEITQEQVEEAKMFRVLFRKFCFDIGFEEFKKIVKQCLTSEEWRYELILKMKNSGIKLSKNVSLAIDNYKTKKERDKKLIEEYGQVCKDITINDKLDYGKFKIIRHELNNVNFSTLMHVEKLIKDEEIRKKYLIDSSDNKLDARFIWFSIFED